jgi:hypothetical protein
MIGNENGINFVIDGLITFMVMLKITDDFKDHFINNLRENLKVELAIRLIMARQGDLGLKF